MTDASATYACYTEDLMNTNPIDHGAAPMPQPFYVPEPILRRLQGMALFYPHSANDLQMPVRMFAPWITDFWFVDLAYFDSDHPANQAKYALAGKIDYEPLSFTLNGPPISAHDIRDIDPCVRSETYRHKASGLQFRVHRRRGYSFTGFRVESFTLGVFFYRGDSAEGSNIPWLSMRRSRRSRDFIFDVLNKLIDGGLIVTDGSRCEGSSNPYKELRRFHTTDEIDGPTAMRETQSFTDAQGRTFRCVGYSDNKYGRRWHGR